MTIHLRNLPPDIEKALMDKSQREGISIKMAATQLLTQALNHSKRNTGFDEFAGTWSLEDAMQFDRDLASMRTVNPQDWKL